MTDLNQYRVQWTSSVGIDGVSTFYSTGAASVLLPRLRTFFEACKDLIPSDVTLVYPGTGNIVDSATGQATATWVATAPSNTICTGGGAYAKPVGAVINWRTSLYTGGRQLRGKTFLVPLTAGAFDTDGVLSTVAKGIIQTAASALPGGADGMQIYSTANRTNAAVTVATVPAIAAVLRSRRD